MPINERVLQQLKVDQETIAALRNVEKQSTWNIGQYDIVVGGANNDLQPSTAEIDANGNLTVAGNVSLTGNLDADGNANVDGNTTLLGTLTVTGASTFTGAVTMESTLNVSGATVIDDTLNVTGAVDFDSTANVDGILNVVSDTFLGGSTTPAAILHLAAGGTTAGSAPLKFTNGDILTTPEAGCLEYKNGHFYATTEENSRLAIVLANNVVTSTTTVTNTVTETSIFSKTYAANALHGDMLVDILLSGAVTNASASDDFSFNFKVGGSTVHSLSRVGGNVTDAGWELHYRFTVRTTGATGTIVDYARYMEGGISPLAGSEASTHTIDTTGTVAVEITMTWANAKAGNIFTATQGFIQHNH